MPFELPVEITGFGPAFCPGLNGQCNLSFSTADIIRAASIAGHPENGPRLDSRIVAWRGAAIRLALELVPALLTPRRLLHPKAWTNLDPSEKGAINNLLGNTVCKLLCERLLDAPRMWFLDVYRDKFNIPPPFGKRPDFFARTSAGEWLALEAKARSNRLPAKGLASAKAQATALQAVNDTATVGHVVCWTRCSYGAVVARMHDPSTEAGSGGFHLDVGQDDLVRRYYAPVEAIMEASGRQEQNEGVALFHFPAGDFSIGLHPQLEATLKSDNPGKLIDVPTPGMRRRGAPFFTASDFLDVRDLASQLVRGANPLLRLLWQRLPERAKRAAQQQTGDEGLKHALAEGLNHALKGASIYQPDYFAEVALSAETQTMLRGSAQAVKTIELNRLLLEDAFPRMVARSSEFGVVAGMIPGPDGIIVVPGPSWSEA